MIAVILVEPEHPGNLGAVARVMKNFGFTKLILVNPKINHLDQEAKNRAKHALNVLKNATITKVFPKLHTLIATTSQVGRDYNIPRSPLTPEQVQSILPNHTTVGIVFGREGEGLSNEEINKCDFTVTIPTNTKYPTLNLSHSVAIILYEISKNSNTEIHKRASKKDKEQILKLLGEKLDQQEYRTEQKKETQRIVWKRMIGKSFLTKREAFALMGFFKK